MKRDNRFVVLAVVIAALLFSSLAVVVVATRRAGVVTGIHDAKVATARAADTVAENAAPTMAPPTAIASAVAARVPATPREATANPTLAAFLDHNAAQRLPIDFPTRVPRLTTASESEAVIALVRDVSELDVLRHEAIELLRRSDEVTLPALLLERLAAGDERERFRSFLTQHLGQVLAGTSTRVITDGERAAAAARLHELLHDPQRGVHREALLALAGC